MLTTRGAACSFLTVATACLFAFVGAALPNVASAAPEPTHVVVRSVSSTMDSAGQAITFDVIRGGDTPLKLAGRSLTVRDLHGRTRTTILDGDSDGTSAAVISAYSTVGYAEDDDSGWGPDPSALWLPPRFLPLQGGTLVLEGMDEWTFGPLPLDGAELMRDGTFTPVPAIVHNTQVLAVREYHHAGMDHYFMTANAVEFDALDSGAVPGWQPTGVIFYAYAGKPAPEFVPMCRLLLDYSSGYSHFMSSFPDECAALAGSGAAILETSEAFYMIGSQGTTCPYTTIEFPNGGSASLYPQAPIYRLWNGKADGNHRYVIDKAERDAMVARGWISEGAGPDGIVLCGTVLDLQFN